MSTWITSIMKRILGSSYCINYSWMITLSSNDNTVNKITREFLKSWFVKDVPIPRRELDLVVEHISSKLELLYSNLNTKTKQKKQKTKWKTRCSHFLPQPMQKKVSNSLRPPNSQKTFVQLWTYHKGNFFCLIKIYFIWILCNSFDLGKLYFNSNMKRKIQIDDVERITCYYWSLYYF
jgi:hypothetical protein